MALTGKGFKINIINLFAALYFIASFEPTYISYSTIHIWFVAYRIVASIVVLFLFVLGKLHLVRDEKAILRASTLIPVMYLIISILNGTVYFTYAVNLVTTVAFYIFIAWFLKKNGNRALNMFANILIVYLILNLLMYFLYPGGLVEGFTGNRREWLLGTKNAATGYYILMLIFFLIDKKRNIFEEVMSFIIMFFYMLIFDCGTGIICAVAGIMLVVLPKVIGEKRILGIVILGIVSGIIAYFLGILTPILTFAASLINRGGTFSGRFAIWSVAVHYIKDFPLLGQGNNLTFAAWANTANIVNTAHNFLLDIACRYGLIAALVVIFFFIKAIISVYFSEYKQSYCLFVNMALIIVLGVVEAINTNILLSMMVIPQFICLFIKNFHEEVLESSNKRMYRLIRHKFILR